MGPIPNVGVLGLSWDAPHNKAANFLLMYQNKSVAQVFGSLPTANAGNLTGGAGPWPQPGPALGVGGI